MGELMKKLFIGFIAMLMLAGFVLIAPSQMGYASAHAAEMIAFESAFNSELSRTLSELQEGELEETLYFEECEEHEFSDDIILVVLSRRATFSFRQFSARDFARYGIANVYDLTETTATMLEEQIAIDARNAVMVGFSARSKMVGETIEPRQRINAETYRRILKLTLQEPGRENVLSTIRELEQRSDIISAEPNLYGSFLSIPNDPRVGEQWALNRIRMPQAWNIERGSPSVTVGVIDSGIWGNHPDLINRIDRNASFCFMANNAAGALSDYRGGGGHGTPVAGIIAAEANNGQGIVGIGWNLRVASLKIGGTTSVSQAGLVRAIIHAQSRNIRILNMSFEIAPTNAIRQAIADYNGLVVAAAGNSGYRQNVAFPASLTAYYDNVIAVGATRRSWVVPGVASTEERAGFSNANCGRVDIYAPGEGILTTTNTTSPLYMERTGTTYAAPHVSGVAALLLSRYPHLTPSQKRQIIIGSAEIVVSNPLINPNHWPRLDAYAALRRASRTPVIIDIWNANDFNRIRYNPSEEFRLRSNINLATLGTWRPIQNFRGRLLGGDFIVSGMSVSRSDGEMDTDLSLGLFGDFRGAIEHVRFQDNTIRVTTRQGGGLIQSSGNGWLNAGIVAGRNIGGTISNVFAYSTNRVEIHRANSSIGGVVGLVASGTVAHSIFTGIAAGSGNLGGIAGEVAGGVIYRCRVDAVHGIVVRYYRLTSGRTVGGIVGFQTGGVVERNEASRFIIYSANTGINPYFGTIVGRRNGGTVTNNTSRSIWLADWSGLFNNNRRWNHDFTRQVGRG